ncbi:hypothetical protein GBF38_001344 [Nibea albiflora]|uniref:Uncharacterized protein n=1 Tax=Nibea albiflora TaxID=240163 RepID=A0ACB7EUF5_NIBAL|nr:hypothetical protein GBF38_001344 [Nibea albiflora]
MEIFLAVILPTPLHKVTLQTSLISVSWSVVHAVPQAFVVRRKHILHHSNISVSPTGTDLDLSGVERQQQRPRANVTYALLKAAGYDYVAWRLWQRELRSHLEQREFCPSGAGRPVEQQRGERESGNAEAHKFDSVFIYALPYGPMPVLFSIHCPHSLLNPDRKLISARSNPKFEPQRPACRAADPATDYRLFELTADKRSGLSPGPLFFPLFEGFNTEVRAGVLKSRVLSWRAAQMSCSVSSAFIRSDGDRRSVSRRRFSNLEMLLEDMKSLLRDEDNWACFIFSN